MQPKPPDDEAELLRFAGSLAGSTLGEVAGRLGIEVPPDLRRAKGWIGTLIEQALGATAGPRDQPDFPELGVELKTLPVSVNGDPRESTFVCTITLDEIGDVEWADSRARRKLRRVLWVPIEAGAPVGARQIGAPLLWTPTADEEALLRHDYEDLAGIIGRGDAEMVTGHLGRWLQVRPKAASSRSRRRGVDRDGLSFPALPLGFYLRTAFTRRLLEAHYALPRPASPELFE